MISANKFGIVALFAVLLARQASAAIFTQGVITPPEGFFGSASRLIDFDRTPMGDVIPGTPTLITDQYAAWGVVFNEDDPRRFPRVFAHPRHVDGIQIVDPVSFPNSLFQGDPTPERIPYPIIIDFKDEAFSQLPTSVGFIVTDSAPNNPLTMQVFDAANNLIETAVIDLPWNNSWAPLPGDNEDTFVGFQSAAGISRIRMQPDHVDPGFVSYEIDNLRFNGSLLPKWNVDADGNWSMASNWTSAVPNSIGAKAVLGDIVTQPRTVTLDVPITIGQLDLDSVNAFTIVGAEEITLDATIGDAQVNVTRGSHTIFGQFVLADHTLMTITPADGNLRISGGVTGPGMNLVKAGAGTLTVGQITAARLSIDAGKVQIEREVGGLAVLDTLSIWGGIAPTATLDLTDRAMVIDYTGTSPLGTVREQIVAGRGGPGLDGSWNGMGITSSAAAAANVTEAESHSIGYAENAALPLGPYSTFRGQHVDNSALLVAFTRTGDANLDGVVNDDDVTIVGAAYAPGVAQPSWALGDFDYNGFVDDDDVTLLGAFYNPSAAPISAAHDGAGAVAAIPEPSSLALLVLAGTFLFLMRRELIRQQLRDERFLTGANLCRPYARQPSSVLRRRLEPRWRPQGRGPRRQVFRDWATCPAAAPIAWRTA